MAWQLLHELLEDVVQPLIGIQVNTDECKFGACSSPAAAANCASTRNEPEETKRMLLVDWVAGIAGGASPRDIRRKTSATRRQEEQP